MWFRVWRNTFGIDKCLKTSIPSPSNIIYLVNNQYFLRGYSKLKSLINMLTIPSQFLFYPIDRACSASPEYTQTFSEFKESKTVQTTTPSTVPLSYQDVLRIYNFKKYNEFTKKIPLDQNKLIEIITAAFKLCNLGNGHFQATSNLPAMYCWKYTNGDIDCNLEVLKRIKTGGTKEFQPVFYLGLSPQGEPRCCEWRAGLKIQKKELNHSSIAAHKKEVDLLQRYENSPYLDFFPRVYHAYHDDYISMQTQELFSQSLYDFIKDVEPEIIEPYLPIMAWRILKILEGLTFKQIVHGDIKPANLLIGSLTDIGDFIIKLGDFECAFSNRTTYAPPERQSIEFNTGKSPLADFATDVWGAGLSLAALLNCKMPRWTLLTNLFDSSCHCRFEENPNELKNEHKGDDSISEQIISITTELNRITDVITNTPAEYLASLEEKDLRDEKFSEFIKQSCTFLQSSFVFWTTDTKATFCKLQTAIGDKYTEVWEALSKQLNQPPPKENSKEIRFYILSLLQKMLHPDPEKRWDISRLIHAFEQKLVKLHFEQKIAYKPSTYF